MRRNERMKQYLSILLCLCMLIQHCPVVAVAAAGDGLCPHHTEHTAQCGYVPAAEGVDCTHVHETAVCGYVEAVQGKDCACEATDENGALVHTEGCGYVPAVAGAACTHVHDAAVCQYTAAVAEKPCAFVTNGCPDCKAAAAPKCTCETKCAEGAVKADCAVCAAENADLTACTGKAPHTHAYTGEKSYEEKHASLHTVTAACPDCPEAKTEVTEEPHSFDENGLCTLCGFASSEVCYCVEKCGVENQNFWCSICCLDVNACQGGEEKAVSYAVHPTGKGELLDGEYYIPYTGSSQPLAIAGQADTGKVWGYFAYGSKGDGMITVPDTWVPPEMTAVDHYNVVCTQVESKYENIDIFTNPELIGDLFSNYNGKYDTRFIVNIYPVISVDPVPATGLVADGTAKQLIAEEGKVSGGRNQDVLYSVTSADATAPGQFDGSLPTATEPGRYKVWFKAWAQGPDRSPDASWTISVPNSAARFVEVYVASNNSYTITFDANGGTGTMEPQSAPDGTQVTLNPNAFSSYVESFDSWNTKKDGTGTRYEDGDILTLTGDLTLYAQWYEDPEAYVVNQDNVATYYRTIGEAMSHWTEGTVLALRKSCAADITVDNTNRVLSLDDDSNTLTGNITVKGDGHLEIRSRGTIDGSVLVQDNAHLQVHAATVLGGCTVAGGCLEAENKSNVGTVNLNGGDLDFGGGTQAVNINHADSSIRFTAAPEKELTITMTTPGRFGTDETDGAGMTTELLRSGNVGQKVIKEGNAFSLGLCDHTDTQGRTYEDIGDGNHMIKCACGVNVETKPHSYDYKNQTATTHDKFCVCKQGTTGEAHSFDENGLCACGVVAYPVWVAGQQVVKVGDTIITGNDRITYDPGTNTLTMNGTGVSGKFGISAEGDLKLKLQNSNSVTTSYSTEHAIDVSGTLTITGGSLKAFAYDGGDGIHCGALAITGSSVSAWGRHHTGIRSLGSVTITNSTVDATGEVFGPGIYAAGIITITDSSVTAVNGDRGAGAGIVGSVTINGKSHVKASGKLENTTATLGAGLYRTASDGSFAPADTSASGLYLEFIGEGHYTLVPTEGDPSTHTITCDCSLNPNYTEAHSFNENGECPCGWTKFPVWVAGTQVEGLKTAESIPVQTGVTYAPNTNTLTLDNAAVIGDDGDGIKAETDLKLVLEGTNTVEHSTMADNGIYVKGRLTIEGPGALTVDNIFSSGDVTITGGTVNAYTYSNSAAICGADIAITGGTVTASGESYGICGSSVTITGGTVDTWGQNSAGIDAGSIRISGNTHVRVNGVADISATLGAGLCRTEIVEAFTACEENAQATGIYLEFIGEGHNVSINPNGEWHTLSCTCALNPNKSENHNWDAEGYCPDCKTQAAASVSDGTNTSCFADFSNAWQEWGANETLTLLKSVEGTGFVFANKANMKLELNGHDITGHQWNVNVIADLTVNGPGKITSAADRTVVAAGDLTVNNATIESTTGIAVENGNTGNTVTLNSGALIGCTHAFYGGNLIAKDGTLTGTSDSAAVHLMYPGSSLSGNVTISGILSIETDPITVTSNPASPWKVNVKNTEAPFAMPAEDVELNPNLFEPVNEGYVVVKNQNGALQLAKAITEGMVTLSDSKFTYSGWEQTPTVSVTHNGSPLDVNDYEIEYTGDKTSAGTQTLIITGKGDYTGTVTKTYEIKPQKIGAAGLYIGNAVYTGQPLTPKVTVIQDKELTEGTDYEVTYENNVNAGTATATVIGKGNYTGSPSVQFVIAPKELTNPTVTGLEESYPYTGQPIQPEITVKDGETVLVKDQDYTLTYGNNTTVAEGGSLTIRFIGNYAGQKDLTFAINRTDPNITLPTGLTATYGDALSAVQLPQADNGTWSWEKPDDKVGNVGSRIHKAVFTPTDANYNTLKRDVTVKVNPKAIAENSIAITVEAENLTYDGKEKTPEVTVSGVPEDAAFDVAYSNNTNAGSATVTVTFKGNYSGTVNQDFTIQPKDLSNATVTGLEESYPYTGQPIRPEITVKDGEKTLVKDQDYDLTYGDNRNAGTGSVSVTFLGNYGGRRDLSFTITRRDPDITLPTGLTATYGDALSSVTLPQADNGTWSWETPGDKVGNAGSRIHKAVFTPADANYNTLKRDVTVKVSPKALAKGSVTVTVKEKLTYDGKAKTPEVTVSGVPEDAAFDVAYSNNTNAGSATVTVTFKGNYSGTFTGSFPIAKAPAKIDTAPEAVKKLVYNGKAQTLVKAGKANQESAARAASDNMEYSLDGKTWSETLPTGTNAGSYTVHYRAKETANYQTGDSKTLTAIIEKAPITVTANDVTVKVGADKIPYGYTVTGLLGTDKLTTEPSFSVADLDLSKTGDYIVTPSGADAGGNYAITYKTGTLKVRAEKTITNNHTANGTVTISPEKAVEGTQVTITVKPKSGYKLSTITVTDANGDAVSVSTDNDGKYYFTMPDANVTVKTVFANTSTGVADPTNPKTGDGFRIVFWSSMMMSGLFGMAVLLLGKKKFCQR